MWGRACSVWIRIFARVVLPVMGLGALARWGQEGLDAAFGVGAGPSAPAPLEGRCCSKAQAELFRPRGYCWRGNTACQPLPPRAFSSPPFWCC